MNPKLLAPLLLLPLAGCGTDAVPATAPTLAVSEPATPAPATTAPVPATPAAKPTVKPTVKPKPKVTTAKPRPKPKPAATRAAVAGAPGRWTLRVTLPDGAVVTGAIQAEPEVRPDVLGVVDVDRDGDPEVFVRVGGGASTTTYAAFALVEDGMAEVRHPGGRPLRLVVGGSATHGDGFRCDPHSLTVLSVVSDDGETYRGTTVVYAWRGDVVTETERRSFPGRSGDPAVVAAYGVDCFSISR